MRQTGEEKLVRRLERLRDVPGTKPSVRRTLDEAIAAARKTEEAPAAEKPAEKKPKARLLTAGEVLRGSGAGWQETWFRADPAEGVAEGRELFQAAWCRGNMILADGSTAGRDTVRELYNKRFGIRCWDGKPTAKQAADTPWDTAKGKG